MKLPQRLHMRIRHQFAERLDAEFKTKFRRNLETHFNLLAMKLVSVPANGKKLTPTQRDWIAGYSAGYHTAMDQITEERT